MPEKILDYSGWYGMRCIFRLRDSESGSYEERITLWRAQNFDEAHELAKREARRYAEECQADFLEHSEGYWIDREIFELDAEVFSWLRESDLDPAEYISTFYSTGREHDHGNRPSVSGGGLEWYGVRCLFWWVDWEDRPFEERITLWQAISADHAVELAEQEAREYEHDSGIDYLEFSQVYSCGEGANVREGMVAFSLLRDSDLSPDLYIATFFNTGREGVRPDRDGQS
jgi:hypothetical protein